jgi:putative transposase
MENFLLKERRISQMNLEEVYFWTDTIKDWKSLLSPDKYKEFIIDLMKELVEKELVTIYCFVIMPNHLHLIWKLNRLNGKEKPSASFNKITAHHFVNDLKEHHPKVLDYFIENTKDRNYRIWKRDPMAILMNSKKKVEQKIDYIHNNPLGVNWNLVKRPEDYQWSSASFYLKGDKRYSFITDYREYFG